AAGAAWPRPRRAPPPVGRAGRGRGPARSRDRRERRRWERSTRTARHRRRARRADGRGTRRRWPHRPRRSADPSGAVDQIRIQRVHRDEAVPQESDGTLASSRSGTGRRDRERVMTETTEPAVILEAMAVIDKGLADMLHRELVSTDEVADLLLDVRSLLAAS